MPVEKRWIQERERIAFFAVLSFRFNKNIKILTEPTQREEQKERRRTG